MAQSRPDVAGVNAAKSRAATHNRTIVRRMACTLCISTRCYVEFTLLATLHSRATDERLWLRLSMKAAFPPEWVDDDAPSGITYRERRLFDGTSFWQRLREQPYRRYR